MNLRQIAAATLLLFGALWALVGCGGDEPQDQVLGAQQQAEQQEISQSAPTATQATATEQSEPAPAPVATSTPQQQQQTLQQTTVSPPPTEQASQGEADASEQEYRIPDAVLQQLTTIPAISDMVSREILSAEEEGAGLYWAFYSSNDQPVLAELRRADDSLLRLVLFYPGTDGALARVLEYAADGATLTALASFRMNGTPEWSVYFYGDGVTPQQIRYADDNGDLAWDATYDAAGTLLRVNDLSAK